MAEQEKPFRFLSEEEFLKLDPETKVVYLVRAQKFLADRQAMTSERPRKKDPK